MVHKKEQNSFPVGGKWLKETQWGQNKPATQSNSVIHSGKDQTFTDPVSNHFLCQVSSFCFKHKH